MSTPSEFYRHAVDLNRFSNAEAKQIAIAYNRLILQAVADLQILVEDERAFDRQTRLREIIRQLRASLNNWAGESSALLAGELQGLATFEEQFIRAQLLEMVPERLIDQVRALQIDPGFARAVVMTDPIEIGLNVLSDDLLEAVGPSPATFRLTATQGAQITLPNGSTVSKAFRGIAESQAELFTKTVQSGFLAGDSGPQMARRLKGRLKFADFGPLSVRQLAQAGGQLTAVANHQVNTLVRTSVNQVATSISQATYKANAEITEKYKYVATLDSRTSARCRALDQQVFEYGKGPTPPQHFNCLPGDAQVTTSGGIAAVYRRFYKGQLYVIKTANGHVLRVTPNHPVLTADGWKPANLVHIGDKVFTSNVIPLKSAANNQKNNAVTTAEDIFRAFRESPTVFSVEVPTTAPDFHGDVPIAQSAEQIAVVLANRELLLAVNPNLLKTLFGFSLKRSDLAALSSSHAAQSFVAVGQSALCNVGSGGKGFAFSGTSASHAGELLFAPVSQLATGFKNNPLNGTWRDAEAIRDAANADALVEQGYNRADVCWIGWEPFSGHVYNFETKSGTYCADSILTHNCRSTTVPEIDYAALGMPEPPPSAIRRPGIISGPMSKAAKTRTVPANQSYGEWLQEQGDDIKRDVLGPSRIPYWNKLVKKYGPENAIRKFVANDGSELTLKQLKGRYGQP
jgi:SPP1 gp7 family putative phage head morphogenesis protein